MKGLLAALSWAVLSTLTVDSRAEDPPVTLRVKPQLCITDHRRQDCETSFRVQWESRRIGDYCLNNDFSDPPLACWEQESSGRFDEDRIVSQSFSYWLRMPGRNQPLAEAKVELLTLGSSDRRRSRRNRHAWSIR